MLHLGHFQYEFPNRIRLLLNLENPQNRIGLLLNLENIQNENSLLVGFGKPHYIVVDTLTFQIECKLLVSLDKIQSEKSSV